MGPPATARNRQVSHNLRPGRPHRG